MGCRRPSAHRAQSPQVRLGCALGCYEGFLGVNHIPRYPECSTCDSAGVMHDWLWLVLDMSQISTAYFLISDFCPVAGSATSIKPSAEHASLLIASAAVL